MTKIPHCALQVYLVLPRAAAVAWGRGSVSLTQAAASQSDSELKLELSASDGVRADLNVIDHYVVLVAFSAPLLPVIAVTTAHALRPLSTVSHLTDCLQANVVTNVGTCSPSVDRAHLGCCTDQSVDRHTPLSTHILTRMSPLSTSSSQEIITGVVQSNTTTGGRTVLTLRPLQLQALHSATRMYTYIILPRSAALSRRMITAFAGTTRALALSAPLQHPVSATTRFVLLPDSTVLHQGVLSTCSPVQGVGGENGGGWLGAGRPRYFVGLENGASDRHSVPHY